MASPGRRIVKYLCLSLLGVSLRACQEPAPRASISSAPKSTAAWLRASRRPMSRVITSQTDVPDPKLRNGPNDGLKRPQPVSPSKFVAHFFYLCDL